MTTPFRRVLDGPVTVGITGHLKDIPAVDWAADEAACRASTLRVLYVAPASRPTDRHGIHAVLGTDATGHEITNEAARRARSHHRDLTVITDVVAGDPTHELIRASEQATVLVVGARRPGRIADQLLTPLSENVATHSHTPVVIVRDLAPAPNGPVLVGLDPATTPPSVLHFAFEHAARHRVSVRLVHAQAPRKRLNFFRVERTLDRIADQHAMEVEQIAAAWTDRYPDIPVDIREARLHPIQALTRESADASLVVVASHSRLGLTGTRMGPVSHGILDHAPVVAVINAPTA